MTTEYTIALVNKAAIEGDISVLTIFKENGIYPDQNSYNLAAENGHLEVIKLIDSIISISLLLSRDTIPKIIKRGHIHILNYLKEIDYLDERDLKKSITDYIKTCEIGEENIEILNWLKESAQRLIRVMLI